MSVMSAKHAVTLEKPARPISYLFVSENDKGEAVVQAVCRNYRQAQQLAIRQTGIGAGLNWSIWEARMIEKEPKLEELA